MSKIIDYKVQVANLYTEIARLSRDAQITWLYEGDAAQKIEQSTPTLMFYGVYNAGKSTLLNAIMGEEVASMADVPETHQVTAYPWNGYELYDTPGINGPKRDYVLSRSELVKHDIIMFLVDDSDSFDSKIVSEEIVGIIESEKPLILVMNNKQTINGEKDEEGITKRGKLYENIVRVANVRGIINVEEKFKFIMIDAYTALRARLENKCILLQASALEDLEDLILQTLKSQEGFKFLLPPIMMMEQQLVNLKNILLQKLESSDEAQFVQLIDDLRESRTSLLERIKSKVMSKLEVTKNLVLNKLMNEQSIDADIKRLNEELQQMIQIELASTMEHVRIDVSKFTANVSISDNFFTSTVQSDDLQMDFQQKFQDKTIDTASEAISVVMQNQIISKGAEKVLTQTILPKIVPPSIPLVNIVLIAKTVYEVISILNKDKKEREKLEAQVAVANAQQEQALYNRQQAVQQLKSQLDVEFYRMNEEIISSVNQTIKATFSEYIDLLERNLNLSRQVNTETHDQIHKVVKLQEQLNFIKVQLIF